ncbi:hypothetical protein BC830DRAFT_1141881 [Chytriomyces sp. MP71]|nr:hypothetical protein BC830DRAFT_1141881 [Chytriomyces sp. MP71]
MSSQSIQTNGNEAIRLLNDLQPISDNPNVTSYVVFTAIHLHIIDGLCTSIWCFKKHTQG